MDSWVDQDLWEELGLWDDSRTRFKQCVLHIGTEKTGSTSLQSFLGANRQALAQAGVFVPASLSPYDLAANHERLTTFALQDDKLKDDLRVGAHIQSLEQVQAHRVAVSQGLRDEVARLPPGQVPGEMVLLLSNEHCQSRLTEIAEVVRLKTFLAEFAAHTRIVVYLRPQHELAISLYDQALKGGYADISILPEFSGRTALWVSHEYFDYNDLLQRWAEVFGPENIEVRIYAQAEMRNGSVIDDFMGKLDVDMATLAVDKNSNVSMSAERQVALNAINRLARAREQPLTPELRFSLIDTLQQSSRGSGLRPSRHEAEAFYHGFSLSNEKVRAAFLPQRDVLFTPDFSIYPEQPAALTETEALAATLIAQQQTINALRARLARR